MLQRDLIVIGTSAGGVEALKSLVRELPQGLPAAICVVLHISPHSPSMLPQILSRSGPLMAEHPRDGDPLLPGRIYVAPPDHHLLINGTQLQVMHGPWENRHRPAVDPLFRSAAHYHGDRVIGVVLTGALDDGTAGLLAIKRHGGVAVVQDPADATYPSMPLNALTHVAVDHTLPLTQIPALLTQLVQESAPGMGAVEQTRPPLSPVGPSAAWQIEDLPGTPSTFTCPGCHGTLWEIQDGQLTRFRCRVGHSYSIGSMFAQQAEAVEEALWIALKTLEESASLSQRMASQSLERGHTLSARHFEAKQRAAEARAHVIRQILQEESLPPLPTPEIS